MTEINRKWGYKNDKEMIGVFYGGVEGFWVRRCSITTTKITSWNLVTSYRLPIS